MPTSFATLVALASVASSVAAGAEFLPLGQFPEGDFGTVATGVSSQGKYAVGAGLRTATPVPLGGDSFRWSLGTGLVSLTSSMAPPFPQQNELAATGVSADGDVVSAVFESIVSGQFVSTAAIWSEISGVTLLSDVSGGLGDTRANGVSGDGAFAIGVARVASQSPGIAIEAVAWPLAEQPIRLGDLPGGLHSSLANAASADGSVIVGNASSDDGGEAFRWTASDGLVGLGDLPGGFFGTVANDVSDDGSVIVGAGFSSASGGDSEAYRWTEEAGFQPLGSSAQGDFSSRAEAVSGNGRVVAGRNGVGDHQAAFIWTESLGITDLTTLLVNQGLADDLEGWRLLSAHDISPDGSAIVGSGINPDGVREGWLVRLDRNIIPEPSAAALLLTASACLCVAIGHGQRTRHTHAVPR